MTTNTVKSHKDLIVWQKSMNLAHMIYALTKHFPKEEMYGLTSQMRRSAVSIPSNIAEGKQRSTRKDFVQFLRIAIGSAAELETQLLLSIDIYPSEKVQITEAISLVNEIQRMLGSIIIKLKVNL